MTTALFVLLGLQTGFVNAEVADLFQQCTLQYKSGDGASHAVAYRLLAPPRLLPGHKYPLVVFLHGKGNRGNDNTSQLDVLPAWLASAEMRARFPCFLLRLNVQVIETGWPGGGTSGSRCPAIPTSHSSKWWG